MFEDFLIFLFIVLGFLLSAGLFHWLHAWKRVYRLLTVLLLAFLISSAGGTVTRLLFNDLPRGNAFSRIFTGVLIIYGIYAFTMFAQERAKEHV